MEEIMAEKWVPKYTAGQVEDHLKKGVGLVVSTVPTSNPNAEGKQTWVLHSAKDLTHMVWKGIATAVALYGCVYVHEVEVAQAA